MTCLSVVLRSIGFFLFATVRSKLIAQLGLLTHKTKVSARCETGDRVGRALHETCLF